MKGSDSREEGLDFRNTCILGWHEDRESQGTNEIASLGRWQCRGRGRGRGKKGGE